MRKRFIVPLTLIFLLMQAMPAWAAVNLNINGKSYVPLTQPQIEQGVTMVSLDLIERVLGADVVLSGQTIMIKKGTNVLSMTLGSTDATFNETAVALPAQPVIVNGTVMAPMRFVYEKFGVSVNWQAESQTIAINYNEKQQNLTAEEMLSKSSEVMTQLNTYKAKVDVTMQSKSVVSNQPGEVLNMNMNSQMLMAIQSKPIVMYMKMTGTIAAPGEEGLDNEAVETEIVMNDNGMFMKMPGSGWLKYNIPGMDMKALMEQSGSQDPLSSLQQMKDYGLIMSYKNDQQKNGKNYWVINITMGAETFNKIINQTMKNIPSQESQDPSAAIGKMMNELLKNMQADITYDVWVDQSNYQMAYMDLDAIIKYTMQLPAGEVQPSAPVSISMDMKEKAMYEIFDLGVAFSVPDVSQAVDFQQYMESQMQAGKM